MKSLIVILTKDRPHTLYRCIQTIIKTNNHNSTWLIIDDSNQKFCKQNFLILQKFVLWNNKIFHVTHKIRSFIIRTLEKELDKELCNETFQKTYTRDISGLRNLGLLCSVILDSKITFLIDDDIVIVKHNNFLNETILEHKTKSNCIIGANLGGIIDESYFGRILYLIAKNLFSEWMKKNLSNSEINEYKKHPLWLRPKKIENIMDNKHASGGLLAFKLNRQSVIPFPSGYNEDWNWCLLQFMIKQTKIGHKKSGGQHIPPTFYSPTSRGMLWEQKGEVIFESLNQINMKRKKMSVKTIQNEVKKTNALNETIKEMEQAKKSLVEFLLKTSNKKQKNEIKQEIKKISNVVKSLNSFTLTDLIESWFYNFEKRQILFSTIFKTKKLENTIMNIIKTSEIVKGK